MCSPSASSALRRGVDAGIKDLALPAYLIDPLEGIAFFMTSASVYTADTYAEILSKFGFSARGMNSGHAKSNMISYCPALHMSFRVFSAFRTQHS